MSEEVLKNDVVETEYDASQIQVLEGLEAGHVHRFDERVRIAPPRL